MPVELCTCETEALELLATDCELKLTADEEAAVEESADEEAADEEVVKLTLLDPVLETVDADEELAACAGAA